MLVFIIILLLMTLGYWLLMSPFSQTFGKYPYRGKTTNKLIALTFDDGPNEPYTSQIAEYLDSKNIKATFFQVGKCIERYPEVSKKLLASGHVIGNHSLSHEFRNYFLHPNFSDEITRNQAIIKKHTGKTPALFRSPWLWRQPWLLNTLRKQSLQPVSGVFCHAFEVIRPSSERIARRAIAKAKPGAIIIFHDGIEGRGGNRQQTVDAVKITVNELIKLGYSFTTIDKLLGVTAYLPSK